MNATRHIIKVADMRVSATPGDELVTYALGSCLGVAIHDPIAQVGGLLHVMMPQSSLDPERADRNPALFVDTGVPELFHACYRAGAQKERLVVKVAGGAQMSNPDLTDHFQIGRRNFVMLRKLLWQNGVLLHGQDIGGQQSRTMTLTIGNGEVTIRANGQMWRL